MYVCVLNYLLVPATFHYSASFWICKLIFWRKVSCGQPNVVEFVSTPASYTGLGFRSHPGYQLFWLHEIWNLHGSDSLYCDLLCVYKFLSAVPDEIFEYSYNHTAYTHKIFLLYEFLSAVQLRSWKTLSPFSKQWLMSWNHPWNAFLQRQTHHITLNFQQIPYPKLGKEIVFGNSGE
jgi:hypothetical protein